MVCMLSINVYDFFYMFDPSPHYLIHTQPYKKNKKNP